MSQAKHTPGPWKSENKFIVADGRIIAEAFMLPEPYLPQKENARLIAAAPDLLAALEAALSYLPHVKAAP